MADIITVLAALGQATRLDVLTMLSEDPDTGQTSGSLAVRVDVPLNSMSTHLGILLRAGLVQARRSGRNILYRLDEGGRDEVLSGLSERLRGAASAASTETDRYPCSSGKGPGHGFNQARPALPDIVRAAWLAELHGRAAERWLAMDPPRHDEIRSSIRALNDVISRARGRQAA